MQVIVISITIFLFSYFIQKAKAQVSESILIDSLTLSNPVNKKIPLYGFAYFHDNTIYFLDTDSGNIYLYDDKGTFQKSFHLGNDWKRGASYRKIPLGFVNTPEDFIILTNNQDALYRYKEGNITSRCLLHLKYRNNRYYLPPNAYLQFYIPEKNCILLPLKNSYLPFYKKGNYGKKVLKYYQKDGLVGFFDVNNGKLINIVGKYDSIYTQLQFLEYLDDISYYYDVKESLLFIGQEATPKIIIYDSNGNEKKIFGENGRSIKPSQQLPVVKNRTESLTNEYHNKIITPSYNDIFYDNANKLIFRIYRIGIEDTTIVDAAYHEYMALVAKGKLKSCPKPNQQEINQKTLIRNKPAFLQIYDANENYTLLEELLIRNNNFKILNVEGDTIWIQGYNFETKEQVIYKYKYLKDKQK